MSGYPRHGTKPQAKALMVRAETSVAGHMLYIYKLRRIEGKRIVHHSGPMGLTKATFPADLDADNHPIPGKAAIEWAKGFPGWEATFL